MQLIHHPTSGGGQEVLYWHTFEVEKLPSCATMTLSTEGFCIAYLNGRILLPSSVWPYRSDEMKGIATREIDVTYYLHQGENTVALCNAPFHEANGVAMAIMGFGADGHKDILCQTEPDWLCRATPGEILLNGESMDGTEYYKHLERSTELKWDNKWVGAEVVNGHLGYWNSIGVFALTSVATAKPSYFEKSDTTLTYYFPTTAEGQLRITLRGMSYGQVLDISGMKYKCNGTTDEQFFTRFSFVKADSIVIRNLSNIKKLPNVQSVEVIKQEKIWMR